MSAKPWFRMYHEALDDPKVQFLSGNDFKAWVNMLMLAARNDGVLPGIAQIAFAFRSSASEAQKTMGRLYEAGLVDYSGTLGAVAKPHGWDDRQYKSDVSTDRVKRFRERSKTVSRNGPDTETEIEAEKGLSNGSAWRGRA